MGQILGHVDNNKERIEYDENNNNGLIMCDKYIPEELISQLLINYVDYKSLLKCQIVCKHWKYLIQNYVWRKKSELIVGQSLNSIKDVSWKVYYKICHKKPFNKNLIKNHSGKEGLKYWRIIGQGGDDWIVEEPPLGVPDLPKEAQFDNKQRCFVTSYITCTKHQIVQLVPEGLSPEFLDKYQPSIEIGEWYGCRWDCPAFYKCSIHLLDKRNNIIDSFNFEDTILDESQNIWHHVSHEFKNYGPGLRSIIFQHEGRDNRYWAGHYGSKMTGAYVIVKVVEDKSSPS